MFRNWVKMTIVLIYLVIIAGATVRMTGSGMGCPDWPKCFGYYIPPTEESQLHWSPDRFFEKGQVIIKEEGLLVATQNFTTSQTFDQSNWQAYTKHDYAIFNVWHTWIEYINRLLGALSGLAIVIMAVLSIKKWRENKWITILSFLSIPLIGFQAWLGATVVYSVLAPFKITLHMMMALVIVGVLLWILFLTKAKTNPSSINKQFKGFILAALVLSCIQIIMGTQTRQLVDETVDIVGYEAKERWLENPNLNFYLHRTFSIVVLIVNLCIWYLNKKRRYELFKTHWVLLLIGLEIATGIAMYYFDFPFLSQPLHLVLASLLFGVQFYLLLEVSIPKKSVLN